MLQASTKTSGPEGNDPRAPWRRSDWISLITFVALVAGVLVYQQVTTDRCDEMRDQKLATIYPREYQELGCYDAGR